MHDLKARRVLSIDFSTTPRLTSAQATLRRACMSLRRVVRTRVHRTRTSRANVRLKRSSRAVGRARARDGDDPDGVVVRWNGWRHIRVSS
jgi:hypothetical protein